ncbi:Aste57867_17459 [Aphanomyces stellatus]|uniref:Aste57867_17459 protein n=1 Tax=Aphanomyces stellatus TaxID=120398 RepID=A0A485LBF5_9STRA|nr:hypothetical protein As57867_017399 [Aphanomyces stellatus]VFT94213.1 Aste57867_17459 [Aphanomyces stellatus]
MCPTLAFPTDGAACMCVKKFVSLVILAFDADIARDPGRDTIMMLSIQNTRATSHYWASPADVVLLPSLLQASSPTTSYHTLDHDMRPPTMPLLPSITSLLHRQLSPHVDGCSVAMTMMAMATTDDVPASPTSSSTTHDASSSSSVVHKPRWRLSKYCTVDACERVSQRNGLCHRHGGKRSCKDPSCRAKDRGNGYCIRHGGGRPCDVANCGKKARRQGMCTQHYRLVQPTH